MFFFRGFSGSHKMSATVFSLLVSNTEEWVLNPSSSDFFFLSLVACFIIIFIFFCVFLLCLDLLFPSVSLRIHQAARVVVLHQQVLLTGHWMEFILGLIDSVLEFLDNLFMSAFFNYEAWFWNWLSLAPIQQFFFETSRGNIACLIRINQQIGLWFSQ